MTPTEQLLDKAADTIKALLLEKAGDIDADMERAILNSDGDKPLKYPVSVRITIKPRGAVGDCKVKVSFGVKQGAEADCAVTADDKPAAAAGEK